MVNWVCGLRMVVKGLIWVEMVVISGGDSWLDLVELVVTIIDRRHLYYSYKNVNIFIYI